MKKRIILIVTDKNGNTKDKRGNPYGYYLVDERELCEQYCRANGLIYKEEIVTI